MAAAAAPVVSDAAPVSSSDKIHIAFDGTQISDGSTPSDVKAEDGGSLGATSTAAGGQVGELRDAASSAGQRVHEAMAATGAKLGEVVTATSVKVATAAVEVGKEALAALESPSPAEQAALDELVEY